MLCIDKFLTLYDEIQFLMILLYVEGVLSQATMGKEYKEGLC